MFPIKNCVELCTSQRYFINDSVRYLHLTGSIARLPKAAYHYCSVYSRGLTNVNDWGLMESCSIRHGHFIKK